jgi:phage/plasmid-associated DNA primase
MNGELESGDTSDGLTRRLVIVNFLTQFVDYPDPKNPYQRQKNVDILDELQVELNSGGIFNWAYAGYQLLNTVGYFTETNDQEQLLTDFKRSSNPILVFYEDTHEKFGSRITNAELYKLYLQWCVDNGEKSRTSIAFHREFKSVAKNDYEPFRTTHERGYVKK